MLFVRTPTRLSQGDLAIGSTGTLCDLNVLLLFNLRIHGLVMTQDLSSSIWDIQIGVPNAGAIMDAIRNGADVNETTENDYTLLMCAAQNGAVENVLCLLSAGANPTVESLGKTASELAREENESEIADIIDAYTRRIERREDAG